MKITVQAVRVYGSKSRYGPAPRLCPTDGPIALERYPQAGERCLVLLGAPPESMLRANQVRRAIGRAGLQRLFGRAPDREAEPEVLIEKALEEDAGGPAASDYNWYVTIVLERVTNVADGSVANRNYLWLDVREATRLQTELLAYARPYIDLLATGLTTLIDWTFFEEVVLDDRVFFSAPSRESFGLPAFSVSAAAIVVRNTWESLGVERLQQVLQDVANLPAPRRQWLETARHWHLTAIREKDPWKQFLWSFLALEILTHKLADALYDDVAARLRLEGNAHGALKTAAIPEVVVPKKQLALAGRFAIVALGLFADSATKDLGDFHKVKSARDSVSHGDVREEGQLPISTVRALVQKYMAGALEFELTRQPRALRRTGTRQQRA